ncbi:MAG: hypothetical protein KatS3mg131_0875 [Candidatus Tectimicrobiota bacterium]|nr:MAG: hypothetical protein KatS3mg131_0875 [Candidatus Tectomicrobia bacterium]
MIEEHFVAASPDGQIVFEILPNLFWQWGDNPLSQAEIQMRGCRLVPPLGAPGLLAQYVIPNFRPGADIREIRPFLEAARAAYEDIDRLWGALLQMQNSSVRTEAVSAVLEYRHGGRVYEERVALTLAETVTPSLLGPQYTYVTPQIYTFRAPKGQLESYETLFATVMASVRVNPVWEQAMVQLIASVNMGISLAAGERARIWNQAMNQIGELRVRTWQQSQETLSRVSQSWSRALRGVDGYLDPITQQTVDLPTGYKNAWSNGMGDYILTPDPGFNPNVELRQGNWQRMRQLQN